MISEFSADTMLLVLSFVLFMSGLNGQEVEKKIISSTGDYYSKESVQINWTLGETVVDFFKRGDVNLSTGFHPINKEVSTSISEVVSRKNISIYPNPAKNILHIVKNTNAIHEYSIYGVIGGLAQKGSLYKEAGINIQNLSPGVYILFLKNENNTALRFVKGQ